MPGIGVAAAAAVKPGPTFAAFFFREHVAIAKTFPQFRFGDAAFYAAQRELRLTGELVARIKRSVGGYGQIVATGAAA